MHKLNILSTMECSDDIAFPRVKKRLLQCKEESEETFELFPLHQIDTLINQAKDEAITMASKCGMLLDSFEDSYLLSGIIQILERAVDEDGEDEEYNDPADCSEAEAAPEATPIFIQEDLTNIRLTKESGNGLPMYTVAAASKGTVRSKTYSLQKRNKTPFILYSDRYIWKTTALYLLQENVSLSNDRLLRVWQNQLSHIHDARNNAVYPENHLKTCDLCMFRKVDDSSKFGIGRLLQFSYMHGSKKGREFSSDYVDFDAHKTELSEIGAFCNWYVGEEAGDFIGFTLTHDYTQGYLSLDNYFMKIPENKCTMSENYGFIITKEYFLNCINDFNKVIG